MSILFTILIIAVSILLVLVVLIQNPKGGGIASGFGASQIMGVKQSTDLVEKATWYLAIGLVVLCLFSAPMMRGGTATEDDEIETLVPAENLPQGTKGINIPQ